MDIRHVIFKARENYIILPPLFFPISFPDLLVDAKECKFSNAVGKLVVVREMFSLSSDGQLLQLEVTTAVAGTEVTNIIIYNKAEN